MSKVDTIKEKYKDRIHPRTFKTFVDGDTTPTKKYLDKMCTLSITTSSPTKRIIETIKKFDSLLPYIENKDIYHKDYDSLHKIFKVIECAEEKKEEKTFIREDHVNVLMENDEYLLIEPKTHVGSLKYGAGTKWCTASKHNKGTFDRHIKDGYLFYLIRKRNKGSVFDKVAFYQDKDFSVYGKLHIFKSNDLESHSSDIFKNCDWDIETFMGITLKINSYIIQKEYTRFAKSVVQDTINSLNKINVTTLVRSLSAIDESDMSESKKKIDEIINNLHSVLTR